MRTVLIHAWINRLFCQSMGWAAGCLLAFFCGMVAHAQSVVVSEVMFHPGLGKPGEPDYVAEDTRKEFIELVNTGHATVDLSGWRFTKGVSFTFPNVLLAPGAFLVVASDSDAARFRAEYQVAYPAIARASVLGGWTGSLSNNGEEIELVDASGQRVDALTYATQGDWALRQEGDVYPGRDTWWRGWKWNCGAKATGKSLELVDLHLSNNSGQNWAASQTDGGTPGGPNSVATAGTAPVILDVRHRPAIPKSTDRVTITARVVPNPGLNAAVSLWNRVDGEPAFASSPMFDDGKHGDGAAGDGIFGGVLEPKTDRTIVEFYVEVTLLSGWRTWPGPTDSQGTQGANALYQVDDSTYTGNQPVYRLILGKSEYDAWVNLMEATSGGRHSDAAMHGTFVSTDGLGTEIRYRVAVRNRGAGTRSARPHNFHVSFPNDQPWRGQTALALNTRTVHSQVAGNAFYSRAGLQNTYGAPVQVRINGANLANLSPTGSTDSYQFGSYYAFEPYAKEWAKSHVPADPDGNIYKVAWYFDGVKLSNNGGDLRYLGDDPEAYRQAYSPTGPSSSTGAYSKQTNVSEDDWSDLVGLLKTLNEAADATFLQEISQVIDVDQWLRHFAVSTLAGNMETCLATGVGDDYSLFAGKVDPRFKLLAHDLDTALGQGDTSPDYNRSIFKAADLPVLDRLLKHPAIAPRYYAILKELAETVFTPAEANALLDQWLGSWVPAAVVQSMKEFIPRRRAAVLAQIPMSLTASSSLEIDAYPRTTTNITALSGRANALETCSVLVSGLPAVWTAWNGRWVLNNVPLNPGVNRVLIQALDSNGAELERSSVDVWYDPGTQTVVPGGRLAADAVWSPGIGPYRVTGMLEVPEGVALTIEPGTTVFFEPGAGLLINGGRLAAAGTPADRIRFTRPPGSEARWAGLRFIHAPHVTSTVACVDIEYADAQEQVISVENAWVLFDRITTAHHNTKTFHLRCPRVVIEQSVFDDVGAHDLLTAEQICADGWFLVRKNLFGRTTGSNDVLRLEAMSCVLRDNVFLGSEGNLVRAIDSDLHAEGNLFMHARAGLGGSAAAAINTSPTPNATTPRPPRRLTLTRNIFFENDYGLIQGSAVSAELYHNVFVGHLGAICFDNRLATVSSPGRECYVESCIFWENHPEDPGLQSGTFIDLDSSFQTARQLSVQHSILPPHYHQYGSGNFDENPRFASPTLASDLNARLPRFSTGFDGFQPELLASGGVPDLRLRAESPAKGRGCNGVDAGYDVSANASVSGIPGAVTALTNLAVTVAGTDIAGYRYRLLGPGVITSDWSAEQAAVKQVSSIQRINGVAITRVPAHGYAEGDIVEIRGAAHPAYNGSFRIYDVSVDAFCYSVSGQAPDELPAIDVRCRKPAGIQLRSLAAGTYTLQVIRKNALGVWQDLDQSTTVSWTVDPESAGVRLNEILAWNLSALSNSAGSYPDAVELCNPSSRPVDLSGMRLSTRFNRYPFVFPAGTILDAGGYLVLWADAPGEGSGLHLGFNLSREGDAVYLWNKAAAGGELLDAITFGSQLPDHSIGRTTDGSWTLTYPTFGGPNRAAILRPAENVVINEWLTVPRAVVLPAFVELFNPELVPVDLAGITIKPGPSSGPGGFTVPPLSFVAAGGFALFYPNGPSGGNANQLGFQLASTPGAIGLFAPDGSPLDVVVYGPQTADISEGRVPDGGKALAAFTHATPGAGNWLPPGGVAEIIEERFALISRTNVWLFHASGIDLGNAWRLDEYNDSGWPAGQALLYAGANNYPVPAHTALSLTNEAGAPIITYYFRTRFEVEPDLREMALQVSLVADDGAVVYLNGERLFSVGMPSDTNVLYSTRATRTVSSPKLEGPLVLGASKLRSGPNLMAVEVHQVSGSSHDIAFALELAAARYTTNMIPAPDRVPVQLNELLARSVTWSSTGGAVPDWLELFNPSAHPVDLSGLSLTDEVDQPRKWVFPPSTSIAAGEFVVIHCDGNAPASAHNTGFGLDASGGAVYLFAAPAAGATLLDAIYYGLQTADLSVGRSESGQWRLSEPTPGRPNRPVALGDPSALKINEWMASPSSGSDWFELFNSSDRPVPLAGLSLTDDLAVPGDRPIPALSFIGAGPFGYRVFTADGEFSKGANHTDFKLSAAGESIGLFAPDGELIDGISFGQQTPGVSQGRLPDGEEALAAFPGHATPGWSNQTGVLEFTAAEMTPDGFRFRFHAAAHRSYSVETAADVPSNAWRPLIDIAPQPAAGPVTILDDSAVYGSARFYRIISPGTLNFSR